MLSKAQAELAVSLLREALDWVGLVDLTTEQEEHAEALQLRIERLLMDCGSLPSRRELSETERYQLLVEAQERCRAAERERILARALLAKTLPGDDAEAGVVAIRRYNRAYSEHERAQEEVQQAEIAYHRALSRHEGAHRCSA